MTNPDIVTILRERIDQCRCVGAVPATRCCGGCEHDTRCLAEIVEVRRERDEAQVDQRRLTEDLRRMDAIVTLMYVSIEKRKLREETP